MKRKINALSRATKKMVSILLAIVFTIAMTTGCSNSTTNDNASAPSEAKTPATPQNINCSSIVNSEPSETRVTEDSSSTDESKDISSSSESEEPVDSDDSSSSGTTPADGLYTYTVYGDIEIRMGINIDDYIVINDKGEPFVRIFQMAADNGWRGNDIYSDPSDTSTDALSSYYFTHYDGDIETKLTLMDYSEYIGDTYTRQLSLMNVEFFNTNTGEYYYGETNDNPAHMDLLLFVSKHYEACKYRNVGGTGWKLSEDDLIIVAYLLWYGSTNPGKNAFDAAQSFEKGHNRSISNYLLEYDLP